RRSSDLRTICHGKAGMTMTANCGNTRRKQQRTHPLGRRATTKKSRRGAAPGLASERLPVAPAKTTTPIAPHLTAFFEQRLPIERTASENTLDSYAYAFHLPLTCPRYRHQLQPSQS